MSMPAITLWAPWGSLWALGFKSTETRSHNRFSRLVGQRIAIHQGVSAAPAEQVLRMLRAVGASRAATWFLDHGADAPRGVVLGTALVASAGMLDGTIEANLAACCPTAGLYGLNLTDGCALEEPIRACGARGVWQWDGEDPWPRRLATREVFGVQQQEV